MMDMPKIAQLFCIKGYRSISLIEASIFNRSHSKLNALLNINSALRWDANCHDKRFKLLFFNFKYSFTFINLLTTSYNFQIPFFIMSSQIIVRMRANKFKITSIVINLSSFSSIGILFQIFNNFTLNLSLHIFKLTIVGISLKSRINCYLNHLLVNLSIKYFHKLDHHLIFSASSRAFQLKLYY